MRDLPGAQQGQLHSGLSEPCKVKARKLWAAPCSGQIGSLWCRVLAGTWLCWTIASQEDGCTVTVDCSSKTASLCLGFPCGREVLTAHLCQHCCNSCVFHSPPGTANQSVFWTHWSLRLGSNPCLHQCGVLSLRDLTAAG